VKAFTFVRPTTLAEAAKAAASAKGSAIKAGGIDLLDRMKERVDEPERVVAFVDVKDPALREIREEKDALVIGALATLDDIATSDVVRRLCPALAEAAGLAASPQIRRRATVGGNLCQHTRCGYYRHASFPCWKRGDDACPVLDDGGVQETAAIFDNRPCASAHPSSLAPVLGACDATIFAGTGAGAAAEMNVAALYFTDRAKGARSDVMISSVTPAIVLTHVRVPASRRAVYEEVRQKAAFDWALVSCCVRVDMDGDKIKDAGVWLGSVAPTPWHADAAEKALVGKPLDDASIAAAADAAVVGATPLPGNAYKVDLVKVVVRRALTRLRDIK
jgi:xanthine dehydrogenase YagS FAD-binding subunit